MAESAVEGVRADLEALGELKGAEGLKAAALVLAAQLDDPGTHATSKANCAKQMLEIMDRLRSLAPPDEKKDGLDELNARREKRLAGRSAASG